MENKKIDFNKTIEAIKNTDNEIRIYSLYKTFVYKKDVSREELDSLFNLIKSKIKNYELFLMIAFNNPPINKLYVFQFINNEVNNLIKSMIISDDKKTELLNFQNEDDVLQGLQLIDTKLGNSIFPEERSKAIIIYLWYVTSNYENLYNSGKISILERAFVLYYNCLNEKNINEYQCDYIPKLLESKIFNKRFNRFYYLFDSQYKENINLKKEKNELIEKNTNLNAILSHKTGELVLQNEQILELKKQVKELEIIKENLNNELKLANGKLQFEENQNQAKLETLKTDIAEGLQSSIQLEIDGIEDVIEFIPDKQREKIQRRLRKIEKRLRRG